MFKSEKIKKLEDRVSELELIEVRKIIDSNQDECRMNTIIGELRSENIRLNNKIDAILDHLNIEFQILEKINPVKVKKTK